MNIFLLIILVLLSTSIWPINKIILKHGSVPERLGMCISFFSAIFALIAVFIFHEKLYTPATFIFGAVMAIGYAIGFCIFILKSMEIGPSGPTVLFNNLGLLFPTVLGIIFFPEKNVFNYLLPIGLIMVIISMILTIKKDPNMPISRKWALFVTLGWLGSGFSMGSQLFASHYEPKGSMSFCFWAYSISFALLLILNIIKRTKLPTKAEILGGIFNGIAQILILFIIFSLLTKLPAALIYPVGIATPIFIMLIIGGLFLKEKLDKEKIIACIIGIIGIIVLSVSTNI